MSKEIVVRSYKHGGSFHRAWRNSFLLDETPDFFVVGSIKTEITEATGNTWESREPAISYYAKNSWFNIVCMFKEHGISYYANLASPTVFDKKHNSLKYVDYDVDIRMDHHGKLQVVDLAELSINSKLYGYPQEIIDVIEKTALRLLDAAKAKQHPFENLFYEKYLQTLLVELK